MCQFWVNGKGRQWKKHPSGICGIIFVFSNCWSFPYWRSIFFPSCAGRSKSFANFRFERLNLIKHLRILRRAENVEQKAKAWIHLAQNLFAVVSMLGFWFLTKDALSSREPIWACCAKRGCITSFTICRLTVSWCKTAIVDDFGRKSVFDFEIVKQQTVNVQKQIILKFCK